MDDIIVIALTGSVSNSPGLSNIFFVNIRTHNNSSRPDLQVCVGYFGAYVSPKQNPQELKLPSKEYALV